MSLKFYIIGVVVVVSSFVLLVLVSLFNQLTFPTVLLYFNSVEVNDKELILTDLNLLMEAILKAGWYQRALCHKIKAKHHVVT